MPKCKDCIHFLVCANVYGEVQADTEIINFDGEQCSYFKKREASRVAGICMNCCARLPTRAFGRTLNESDSIYCYRCGVELHPPVKDKGFPLLNPFKGRKGGNK